MPSPPGKVAPHQTAGYVSRAFLTRLTQTQREADEGWGAQRHTMQLVECSIPSSVCFAVLRSHLPPREGSRADEGIGPYKECDLNKKAKTAGFPAVF